MKPITFKLPNVYTKKLTKIIIRKIINKTTKSSKRAKNIYKRKYKKEQKNNKTSKVANNKSKKKQQHQQQQKSQYISPNTYTNKYNASTHQHKNNKDPLNNTKTQKYTPKKQNTITLTTTSAHLPLKNKELPQTKSIPNTKNKPTYTFHNKKILLKYGDIESNFGPKPTLLANHPQIDMVKQKTYFYKKTIQIKPEYKHILKTFLPYLYHIQTVTINPHLTQFCKDHNHSPKNYTFYALIITLATTPTQCNQLIADNSTQWTIRLIRNLLEWPNPMPTDQYKIINFHLENTQIIKPMVSIQKELYSLITNGQTNLATLQNKFPYLPKQMIQEALKCLQPVQNYTHPSPIQNYPPIKPQNTPYTNPHATIITWNYGALNTALPGIQSLTNKPIPPSIIAIQETKLTASKSTKYLQRLFPQYKMIFNNTNTRTQHHRIHGQPYINPRGELLTLIHQNYAFLGNITKTPFTTDISLYLQITKIANTPLPTCFLIHIYMPTHIDDITLIPIIQKTIFNHLHNNPLSNIILLGDFNKDIALVGQQHGSTRTAPTQ